ncbi:DUF6481 family protein [Sphingomonas sp. TZW2008]|uniref:DUF6481 family protein n=1 Tax=Sphingomonas sp. TZW2008 TaxID=1917973 RepID=UPI000A26DB85|nr:DUF6481 family protein [Sphingomonas sp. TZW2008]
MAAFKNPTFQDRADAAANARQKALEKLKTKPPVDKAVLEQRRLKQEAREQAEAEQRAARAEAIAAQKAERAEKAAAKAAAKAEAEAAAALKAKRLKPSTPEEMKAARDARYAARKARK